MANLTLNFVIPIDTLRQWYPGPNWKKNLKKLLSLSNKEQVTDNFLFTHATFTEEGLHISINPQTLAFYSIDNTTPYSKIDYNVTIHFLCKYSHEIYWRICKHCNYTSFLLNPKGINHCFRTQYNISNINNKILMPVQKEMQQLYKQRILPQYFEYERIKEIENLRKISTYKIIILPILHNTTYIATPITPVRTTTPKQQLLKEIKKLLHKQPPLYEKYILQQIKQLDDERIQQLKEQLKALNEKLNETKQTYEREIDTIISQMLDTWKEYLTLPHFYKDIPH